MDTKLDGKWGGDTQRLDLLTERVAIAFGAWGRARNGAEDAWVM